MSAYFNSRKDVDTFLTGSCDEIFDQANLATYNTQWTAYGLSGSEVLFVSGDFTAVVLAITEEANFNGALNGYVFELDAGYVC